MPTLHPSQPAGEVPHENIFSAKLAGQQSWISANHAVVLSDNPSVFVVCMYLQPSIEGAFRPVVFGTPHAIHSIKRTLEGNHVDDNA